MPSSTRRGEHTDAALCAVRIIHDVWDKHPAFWARLWLFGSSLFFEDHAGGRAWVVEALQLCQALRKRRGELFSLSSLAMVDFYMGDDVAARHRYEQVIPLTQALDDRWAEMRVQRELSEVLRVQGEYARAQALLIAAITAAREMGNWYEATWALATLVRLHCQVGDATGARVWHDQLIEVLGREELTPDCQAVGLRARAVYALHAGDPQQALAAADAGMQLTEQYDIPIFRAEAAVILGHARARMEQPAAAALAYQQAVTWYAKIGNAPLAGEPRAGLAQLALEHGDHAGALTLVDPLVSALAEQPRACVRTPFYASLICYRVLEANHDSRAAPLLRTTRQRLQECARRITDDALHRSFLENVPAHRELLHATGETRALAETRPHV